MTNQLAGAKTFSGIYGMLQIIQNKVSFGGMGLANFIRVRLVALYHHDDIISIAAVGNAKFPLLVFKNSDGSLDLDAVVPCSPVLPDFCV